MMDNDISLDTNETNWLVNFTLSVIAGGVLLTVTSVTAALYVLLS
jgi:hypothetical protein